MSESGWQLSMDGPFCRVRTKDFEATFVLGAEESAETVENVDVEVRLGDGSRWTATVITLAEADRLMRRRAETGEALSGRYFWVWDGLIVRDPGVASITRLLADLLETGEFTQILRRLDG